MALSDRLFKKTVTTIKKDVKPQTAADLLKESVKSVVEKRTPIVTTTRPVDNKLAGPYAKDFKPVIPTFAPAEALAKKFLSSATLGLTEAIKTPYTQTVEEKAKTMPVASTVANVAGYLSPGTAGAKLVKPLLKNVGSKLGKQALEGAIVGTGITAAENVVPLLKGEKDIQQVGKDVGMGLAGGIALDVGLYGLGKLAKPLINKIRQGIALSQSEKQAVAQTLNVPVDNVDETVRKLTIQEELGLPKDMTAQQYQDKLQADAYVQSLKKSPQQIVDDFTKWRSKNFGGATGKMPPQDIKALKELYKEDTGIDFDTEFAQSKQDFVNEMGRGKQITTNKLTVKPVVEPPKPQQTVNPIYKSLYRTFDEFGNPSHTPFDDFYKTSTKTVKPLLQATESPTQTVIPNLDVTLAQTVKPLIGDSTQLKDIALQDGGFSTTVDIPKVKSETTKHMIDDGKGTAEELRQRIVSDVKKPKTTFKEAWEKAQTQFIDDTAPLKVLEKKVTGKIDSAEKSIYKTAALYRGAPERADEIIRTGVKPAIETAEKAGYTHEDLRDYAIAVHAKEVNEAGINSGISTSAAEDTIRKFGTPEMEQARQQLLKVSNDLVDDMYENGLLDKKQYEGLKTKWKNYMPLFREFDDDQVPKAFSVSDKLSGASAPIKGLKGSERKVIDPLQGMIRNIYATQNAIAKNKVGLQLARLSDIDTENMFIRQLDKNEEVGRKNVVNVMVNGEKQRFEVEPEVYKMLEGLDKEASNWIISAMSKPASILRAGATLTPEFALRNPMRDVVNAYVVSKSGFNPFTDFAKGLASVMKKDEYYSQFLKENGGFGNIFSMDRAQHKKALEKVITQKPSEKFVNLINPKSYIELLRAVSDVTESATKVGEFRKALSKGETPQEAAYRARNLMDFGKAGSSIRPANKMIAFLNANIRGKATLIEAIKDNPVKVTGKIMSSMVLPSVAFKMYSNEFANEKQKQTIKDAPDWLKDTFWLVPVPGTDIVARIPKPFDISAAANATERFIDYVIDNDKEAFDGFAKSTLKGMSIPVMMTGVLPILEASANYSNFKQGPIIPEREKFLPRKYQADSKTSNIAKGIAGGIGAIAGEETNFASPRTIDYVIRSSTGGLGSTSLDAMDWLADSIGFAKKPPKPSVGVTGLPVVKGFTVSELSSGKSVGELYDLKNKLTTEKGGLKFEAKKLNKNPKSIKFENEKVAKFVNGVTEEISDISKEMRDTTESMTLTSDEKRTKLKELNDARNKLAFDSLKKAKEMLKK